jgi:glycerol kinase
MNLILTIDQSTSATKAMLFSRSGRLVDKVSVPHEQIYPRPGWVEHDAEEIYQNTIQSVRTLLEQNSGTEKELLCLSITNQRETIVVFDRQTGKPLHNAIVWQCRRGSEICAALVEAGKNEIVQQKTGLPIDTYFSASKLKWLVEYHPEIQKKIIAGDALVGTIDTYLIYRLTKGGTFASDQSNACRTLLFDIKNLRWDEELCEIFDVPIQALPEVRESSARFGETDIENALASPLPICGVMGDSQAALYAQRCYDLGAAKVTFGTGSSVLLNIGGEMIHSDNGIVTTIAWVYVGEPTYAFEGITNFTGGTIAWLQDQMEIIADAAETENLARSVEDNGGVYLVPAFIGLSAPYWQPNAKAAVLGLTPHSTKAHIVRAALESIAYRIRDVLSLMAQDAGVEMQYIHADGGGVGNRFLMQFVADMLGITVRASSLPELSALGAVFSGMLGMGVVQTIVDLGQLPMESVDYAPKMERELADKYYLGWQAAVQQVLYQPKQG